MRGHEIGAARRGAVVLAAGLAVLMLAGCGATDEPEAVGAGPADQSVPGADEDGSPDRGEPANGAGGQLVDPRQLIYTGALTVTVPDVPAAAAQALTVAERHQGFVGGDQRFGGDHGAHATLVLRIPSARFTVAVDELSALGEERDRDLSTEDVTDRVVDIEARLATVEGSLARTRELLDRAESIADIVVIEEELTQREGELAELQARQRRLADLITYSTLTLALLPPEAAEERDQPGFVTGLDAGWQGFRLSMTLLLTMFGFLLPWLTVAGLPTGAVVWWLRRRRRPVQAPSP